MSEPQVPIEQRSASWSTAKVAVSIIATLVLFLFGLDLMISSIQHIGGDTVKTILNAAANPFTGLFIGLLVTAMIQSSSTTTALAVAMVASGSMSLSQAIPVIMGANVGTTITSTIVSLGFINKKKEFRRAVAAGSFHCFFNLLTVVILFPLEYYYATLSRLSQSAASFFIAENGSTMLPESAASRFSPVVQFFIERLPPVVLIFVAFVLLFGSILLFRRLISKLLKANSPEAFSRFFFKNNLKSFIWGVITTAAIRSSTITTSVVVAIVAKKIVTLRQAAPYIMGANIGTTITAFIAALLNSNFYGALSLALAHFLFNLIGFVLFFFIPGLNQVPLALANGLGKLTQANRLIGFAFILFTFFVLPFTLIYLNQ